MTEGIDPAGLGRGPLTRWLPVLWRAPVEPPEVEPFATVPGERPGAFVARVILSLPRVTVPSMLLAIVWQVGESAVPVVMSLAIDRALATGDSGQLALWIGALVALYVTLTAAARLSNRLSAYAIQLLQHRLRATLSAKLLHPGAVGEGAAQAPDGAVVSTMTNDVFRLSNAGLLVILPVARIAAILFIAVSLLLTHWLLGIVVLIGAPVAVWLGGRLSERFSRDTRAYQQLLADTVGQATDLVAGYRVVKGVGAEAEATRRYTRASQEALVGARRNAGLLGRFLVGAGTVNGVFVAAVTGLAGWLAVDGRLSIGGLIAAVGLTQALLPQMEAIAGASIPNYAGSKAAAARILAMVNARRVLDPVAADAPDADAAPGPVPAMPELEVAGFGSSIQVRPGELVGVRADDRTAARIVDALLNPRLPGDADERIEVRLGAQSARRISAAEYRAHVTVAPHRATLFTGSIRDNLTLPAQAPGLLEAAVQAAACEDFADDLDSQVGEGGNRLSGGQRQRIALARALASDAPVLVLHDPTTAVDSVTEHAIAERLRGIREGRSTLLIASSPALLGRCDRVVDLVGAAAPDPAIGRGVAP